MPKKGIIRVATCQFAVGGSVTRNAAQIRKQIEQAAREMGVFLKRLLNAAPP